MQIAPRIAHANQSLAECWRAVWRFFQRFLAADAMKYRISYFLDGGGDCLSYRDATDKNNLQGLPELLKKLQVPGDVITVHERSSGRTIQLWFNERKKDSVVFEVFDVSNYWKEYRLENLDDILIITSDVERFIFCDRQVFEALGFVEEFI
jgi:hypothetical protein